MVDALQLNATALLAIATLGISLMLLLVSIVSYARLRSTKLLLTGGAFLFLALKGGLWAWRSTIQREADVTAALLDFLVLGFLYASVAKR
ncbi:MAG: hypothetical protein WDA16_12910 [Candidatus Thermoplasmatota archaeon]